MAWIWPTIPMEGCIAFYIVVLTIQRVQRIIWSVVLFRHAATILASFIEVKHLPNAPSLLGIKGCPRSELMPTNFCKALTKDTIAPLSMLLQVLCPRSPDVILDLRKHGK
jgi:hypothetical protein